ncbi:unnamed protein product [Protopolystoma xenopodis]|uniref:Uncharacterized protein n=1 Tax=Protopolystoma xenopodis TaxID=117903 RepID=A0A448WQ16_9PLAT|nr:unnamed protein product [Protopolystoma xenopodis]
MPTFVRLPSLVSYSASSGRASSNELRLTCRVWPPNALVQLVAVPDRFTAGLGRGGGTSVLDQMTLVHRGLGLQRYGVLEPRARRSGGQSRSGLTWDGDWAETETAASGEEEATWPGSELELEEEEAITRALNEVPPGLLSSSPGGLPTGFSDMAGGWISAVALAPALASVHAQGFEANRRAAGSGLPPDHELILQLALTEPNDIAQLTGKRLHCLARTSLGGIISRPFRIMPASKLAVTLMHKY